MKPNVESERSVSTLCRQLGYSLYSGDPHHQQYVNLQDTAPKCVHSLNVLLLFKTEHIIHSNVLMTYFSLVKYFSFKISPLKIFVDQYDHDGGGDNKRFCAFGVWR